MTKVTSEDVEKIADLAQLELKNPEEFVEGFNGILEYFDELDEIPETVDIDEEFENVVRPDEIKQGIQHSDALENAAETEDGYIKSSYEQR